MGRMSLLGGLLIGALACGACGSAVPGGAGTPTPVSVAGPGDSGGFSGGGVGDSTDPFASPTFPLTLHRTGGIAGYDDTVVLRADGTVLVETRSIRGRVCSLPGGQQRQLVSLLGTLRLTTEAPTSAGLGDVGNTGTPGGDASGPTETTDEEGGQIAIAIHDKSGRPLDLSDPSLGEVSGLVSSLVADVTLSEPATTRCTTPTSPRPAPPT